MSQVISWLGNAEYGVAGTRLREGNPVVFRPTDISGLQCWLDANDSDSVNANPFGTVESWHNKGDLSGNFDLSGTADVRYGENFVNTLNAVTFNGDAFMTGTFALNFQDRSMFLVARRNQDISGGLFGYFTSDDTDGMETGIVQSGANYIYALATHPGSFVELAFTTTTNTTGYSELVTFINSSIDVSGNYVGLNSVEQTPVVNNLASFNTSSIQYFLGNYLNGSTLPNDYDMCEVIIYDSVVTPTQRASVEEYLTFKWGVVEPPPPPPVPFAPTDIAGLNVWLDGSNSSSISVSGTDVLSWSNVGSAGGSFVQGSNIATYSNSIVDFNVGATLDAYMGLPYYSRTLFGVLECKSDLSTITYPYLNFQDGGAGSGGRQAGISWAGSNYQMTTCQAGINCPVVGSFNSMPSGLFLTTMVVDETNASNNAGYLNNGSNLNTSSDLGNLFNVYPIPYVIGNTNGDSPAFRMAEFLEYDTVLSSSNISTVTGYLSDKWGLGL